MEGRTQSSEWERLKKSKIPSIIWTYWDGDLPHFIINCILSWSQQNPTYKVILLNKVLLHTYLPEINFEDLKHTKDQPARFSDYVRLNILQKYGGIWIDASTICNTTLDWIHGIQNAYDVEFVGYYLEGFTNAHMLQTSPVVESWFLACIPQSNFISNWCHEFMRSNEFDTIQEYIDDLKEKKVIFQDIQYIDYLTIHLSAQYVLQNRQAPYKLFTIKAEDGPLKWLADHDWDIEESVKSLFELKYSSYPLNKLRGCDRQVINEQYKHMEYKLFPSI